MQNFSQSKNKFSYIYVLTLQSLNEQTVLTGRFLKRKLQEYEALRLQIKRVSAEIDSDGISTSALEGLS